MRSVAVVRGLGFAPPDRSASLRPAVRGRLGPRTSLETRGVDRPQGSGGVELWYQSEEEGLVGSDGEADRRRRTLRRCISTMRPTTIVQAVGAFLVGRLVILLHHQRLGPMGLDGPASLVPIILASFSIYLGYGSGMAMNDVADAAVDAQHASKKDRSVASGDLSATEGRMLCLALSVASIALAGLAGGSRFATWTVANLGLMLAYAMGLQRIFLAKNLICGFLAASPLAGACLLGGAPPTLATGPTAELLSLAAVGLPLQVAREILKDAEDVDVDRGSKRTLPLAVGVENARRVAYAIVAAANGAMILLPRYWKIFASRPPTYGVAVAVGTAMCARASMLPLSRGQRMLKRSVYVLLAGMISGLLLRSCIVGG
ncbi:hypothetical protein ACHAWF_014422 [Thalassiosira exigua]